MRRIRLFPGHCQLCSKWTLFYIRSQNLREDVFCIRCKSSNRQRQLTQAFIREARQRDHRVWLDNLHGLKRTKKQIKVWNTESRGSLQKGFKETFNKNLICSEFIANNLKSGEVFKDVLHVDLCSTHFKDEEFDFILSSDVLEHIPNLNSALQETYRVLKKGGSHIFTIPFFTHRSSMQIRAFEDNDGNINHLLKPWFHIDPLREEGTLCFRVFTIEILVILEKIGFDVKLINIHSVLNGNIGSNGYVFIATKKDVPVINKDPIENFIERKNE